MLQVLADSFRAGLITFRELTVLQVLASFALYPDSLVFPSLKTIGTMLAAKLPKGAAARARNATKRGDGTSARTIRRCMQRVEARFSFKVRAARFREKACLRRQTSNFYDIRGLIEVLEDQLLQLHARAMVEDSGSVLEEAAPTPDLAGGVAAHMAGVGEKRDPNPREPNSPTTQKNNNPAPLHHPPTPVVVKPMDFEEKTLEEDLTRRGVLAVLAWKLVNDHHADEIRRAIAALEREKAFRIRQRRKPISHPGRWLWKAITEGWRFEDEASSTLAPPAALGDREAEELRKKASEAKEAMPLLVWDVRESLWQRVKGKLRDLMDLRNYRQWIEPLKYVATKGGEDYIEVPRTTTKECRSYQEWLTCFEELFEKALGGEGFQPVYVPRGPFDLELEVT